jgi:hypothetical protein
MLPAMECDGLHSGCVRDRDSDGNKRPPGEHRGLDRISGTHDRNRPERGQAAQEERRRSSVCVASGMGVDAGELGGGGRAQRGVDGVGICDGEPRVGMDVHTALGSVGMERVGRGAAEFGATGVVSAGGTDVG